MSVEDYYIKTEVTDLIGKYERITYADASQLPGNERDLRIISISYYPLHLETIAQAKERQQTRMTAVAGHKAGLELLPSHPWV